ncbi:MAG: hypothetical protein HYS27_21295 [Deltaproteobacteria bacterium]|nr:hypothetical protein [Deltaproteobacteria bacterium]
MDREASSTTDSHRGYSLPVALLLLALLAAAASAAILALRDSAATTATAINRRQSFYACDGVGRVAMIKAREYMQTVVTPTTNGVMNAVCGSTTTCPNAPLYAPTGYTIDKLELSTDGSSSIAPLPNGPFRGMIARQTKLTIDVDATKNASGARCHVDETVVLGQIGLFQFFVFADGYMDLFNGPEMSVDGRIHVNGDWCSHPAGSNFLRIRQITASGAIRHACSGRGSLGGSSRTEILVAGTGTLAAGTRRELGEFGQSGCVACSPAPGVGTWMQYALARWNGNVQDSAHSVPRLTMPFVGSAAVQDGRDQSGGGVDNSPRMRAIIDPVMPGDAAGVRSQKLAWQADLRIINGVWYLNDGSWPGRPIWSDHPLNFATKGDDGSGAEVVGLPVGQAQLFPSGTVPRRYSYYEFDRANGRLFDGTAGGPPSVISYGTLFRTTANPGAVSSRYVPGFHRTTTADTFCSGGTATDTIVRYDTACPLEDFSSGLLQGTRGGFQDPRMRGGLSGGNANKYRMLPLNFDVEAFALALQDTSAGELGSLFPGGFNGIIYIANFWPGSTSGMNTAAGAAAPPPLWPDVHSTVNTYPGAWNATLANMALPRTSGLAWSENNRLPMNLCGDGVTAGPGGTRFSGRTTFATFTIPRCEATPGIPQQSEGSADLTNDDHPARPNAVRLIHAATIDPVVFPRGLSIVSNGPVYLMGDTNSASNGLLPANQGGNWRPLMVAGDATTFVSNAWRDDDLDWSDSTAFDGVNRPTRFNPTDTRYLVATIAGNVETSSSSWGGGVNNFPRFIERWSTACGGGAVSDTTFITGSLVSAFRSVYQWQPWGCTNGGETIYNAPTRTWEYDQNLALPANQPPGTPSFFVQAVQRWDRD